MTKEGHWEVPKNQTNTFTSFQNTETIKIVESKLTTKTIMQEPPKEKRQAFGDIFNKLG